MFLRKLGKRGAEMVEYAIVLACIAAVGVGFYSSNDSKLTGVLGSLFGKVTGVIDVALGNDPLKVINRAPLKEGDYPEDLQYAVNIVADGIYQAFKDNNITLRSFKINSKGDMVNATYWKDDGTYDTLPTEQYVQSNFNSMFGDSGYSFAVDDHGSEVTQLYFNESGSLVMPNGYNQQQQLSGKFWPQVVIKKDTNQYLINNRNWSGTDGCTVNKDNTDSYLNVTTRVW